jgi:hypothetical protein
MTDRWKPPSPASEICLVIYRMWGLSCIFSITFFMSSTCSEPPTAIVRMKLSGTLGPQKVE